MGDCAMSEDKKPAHTHVVKFLGGDITVIDEYNGQMINEDNRIIQAKNDISTASASRSPRSQKRSSTPTKALSKQRSLKRMVSLDTNNLKGLSKQKSLRRMQSCSETNNPKTLSKQKSLRRMVSDIIPTTVHTTGYYDDDDDTSISMDIDSSYFSATPTES